MEESHTNPQAAGQNGQRAGSTPPAGQPWSEPAWSPDEPGPWPPPPPPAEAGGGAGPAEPSWPPAEPPADGPQHDPWTSSAWAPFAPPQEGPVDRPPVPDSSPWAGGAQHTEPITQRQPTPQAYQPQEYQQQPAEPHPNGTAPPPPAGGAAWAPPGVAGPDSPAPSWPPVAPPLEQPPAEPMPPDRYPDQFGTEQPPIEPIDPFQHTGQGPAAPVSGTPVSGTPVSGTPSSGAPVSGTPSSGGPVSGVPVSGTPVSGTPVSGTPVSAGPDAGSPDAGAPEAAPADAGPPSYVPLPAETAGTPPAVPGAGPAPYEPAGEPWPQFPAAQQFPPPPADQFPPAADEPTGHRQAAPPEYYGGEPPAAAPEPQGYPQQAYPQQTYPPAAQAPADQPAPQPTPQPMESGWPPSYPQGYPQEPTGYPQPGENGATMMLPPQQAGGYPGAPQQQSAPTGHTPTADDFARRRAVKPADPVANAGIRRAMRVGSFGLVKLGPGRKEQEQRHAVEMVRRNFGGLRQVTVINPKGGAGKTVAVLMIAMTFGQRRGGYVLAWDNNETQGTLGMRAQQDFHNRTVRDLLRDLDHFQGPTGRVGDLSQYVRAQGEAMFDVLASDESATAGEMLTSNAFREIREVVSRFYKLIVVDTGNNVRAANWQSAIDATDQLVVCMSARNDSAETAARALDHLEQTGRHDLVRRAVTVVSMPAHRKDLDLPAVQRHFSARTRAVLLAPYEKLLDSGEPIRYSGLTMASRESWLKIAASVAEGL